VRFGKWLCLVLGVGFLVIAVVTGVIAVRSAVEVSAYHQARACLAGAPPAADCRQVVTGAVTGVVEYGGKSPDYALDVQTATGTLHIDFPSDSDMLSYAVDGNPAVVTMWREIPVAVTTDGRTEPTAQVPDTALAQNLGECAQALGVGVFFVLGGLAMVRNQRAVPRPMSTPSVAAWALALGLGALIVAIGGFTLGGHASRIGPVLVGMSLGLAVVAGLSTWVWISARRRIGAHQPAPAGGLTASGLLMPGEPVGEPAGGLPADGLPVDGLPAGGAPVPAIGPRRVRTRQPRRARPTVPLRMRLHPAAWLPVLRRTATSWSGLLLTVAVLLALLGTAVDGPPARAFRHAPACVGETNLRTCVGEFTAVINGFRTPAASNHNYADVSYVTADGAINAWVRLDGNSAALGRAAAAAESSQAPLTIEVWRKNIVGAQLSGTWHWAQGSPPGDTIPAVFLSISFGLLLLVVWLRVHRLNRRGGRTWRALIRQDLGQAAVGAGAIALLAYGFWPAAFLLLAVLAWLGASASIVRRRARSMVWTS
jgi:hypothetical protein